MTDKVRITRETEPIFDTATGKYTPTTTTTTVYEGPARLKLTSSVVGVVDAQGQNLASQSPRLDLPVKTSGAVRVHDAVEVTASEHDPANIGLRLTIEGRFFQTDATARRFPVEVQS